MSTPQKIMSVSSVVAIAVAVTSLILTTGAVPFKAGVLIERIEHCERQVVKVDEIAEDVAYIRGWIDSEKDRNE